MSKSNKDIFQQIVLVNVDNAIWSGYKRTTEGDLAKMNATLPGGGIITKGGKKIFPTESFTPFNTLKKEISRKLMSVGVSALGGSARVIPSTQVKEIQKFLDEGNKTFNTLLAEFESEYDTSLENHLNSIVDPVVREIVERSTLTKDEAIGRFRYVTDVFKIVPKGDGVGLVNNLANKLFTEVATAARDAYDKSFLGKPRVGQRALNQVVALRNKLSGLSMLDGKNIQSIVDSIDGVLKSMPADGWIEGVNYSALIGLVSMLCDPEDMLRHAEKIQQGIASSIAPVVDVVVAVQNVEAVVVAPVVEQVKPLSVQPQLSLVEPVVIAETEKVSKDPILPIVKNVTVPAPAKKVAAFF